MLKVGKSYTPFGWNMPGRKFNSNNYRFGFNGMEKDPEISNGNYTTHFRALDTRIGRWLSNDPVVQPHQSPYCSMDGNPILFSDVLGNTVDHTIVDKQKDGTYKVIGGDARDGDNGIYLPNENGGKGMLIGYSATPESFYFSETDQWLGTINPNDLSGKQFLNKQILKDDPNLIKYMSNATGGNPLDFKRTNALNENGEIDPDHPLYNSPDNHYRGMPLLGDYKGKPIYASARDVGNIAAGVVAGRAGLAWENARIGFDGLQSYQEWAFSMESSSTRYGERLGYRIGSQMFQKYKLGRLPSYGTNTRIKISKDPIFKGAITLPDKPNKPIPYKKAGPQRKGLLYEF